LYTEKERATLDKRAATIAAKKAAKWEAIQQERAERAAFARQVFEAEHPGVSDYWLPMLEGTEFGDDLAAKLQEWGSLSEKQVAAVCDRAQQLLNSAPCISGREQITGKVLKIKWQDSQYGGQLKCLIADDRGFKVWGTVPRAIDNAEQGDRVTFVATVEPSQDDESFGFYKRPSKAEILDGAAA
jgi:hypothetical protein